MRGHLLEKVWSHDPSRYAPPRYRRACSYAAFLPDPVAGLDVTLPGPLAGIVADAEARILSLNHGVRPELAPFARFLLRTESVASSRIEGIQADARTLARAGSAGETGRAPGSAVSEILGNIEAMAFAIERVARARTLRVSHLRAIHEVLLREGPNAAIAGRIRTAQNWIGGNAYNPCDADFVPPPPEHVPALLDDLCRFCEDDTLPPLVRAAIAHAQFETIHPFADGNGRTGRALVHVLLRRSGLASTFVPPISVELARDKERYVEGLRLFREDRIDEWLEIFAVASARAADLAERYAARVEALRDRWRAALQGASSPRADAAAWAIIDVLPAHPIVTVATAAEATARTKPAVNGAIAQLEAAGVLQPVSSSKRNRAWEADGLLRLLVEAEQGR